MAIFKILKGEKSRIDTKTTEYHEGYAYFTPEDAGFYIDADGKRTQINKGNQTVISREQPSEGKANDEWLEIISES